VLAARSASLRRGCYSAAVTGTEAGSIPDELIVKALKRSAVSCSCGFFLDFDGVLATIEVDPEAVSPVAGVVEQLTSLSRLVKKVAVISARPVEFLARQFRAMPDVALYGLYGLEAMINGAVSTDERAAEWVPAIRSLLRQARQELPAGVYVEDKRIAMVLHYRQYPEHKDAVQSWATAKAEELGLLEQSGRMVVELKPPVAVDKGTVLADQISDLACAWYFGDDISDAKAFAAVRARQREHPEFVGVCVAVRNSETGQSLEEQADLVLPGPGAMPAMLAKAVEIFSASQASFPA
jgi:trehalose 6-phosphate phosphatase